MIKAVIFDLDDTLYNEIDYVKSAYKEIEKFIEKKYKIKNSYNELMKLFNMSSKNVFNRLFEKFNISYDEYNIEELVNLYRNHKPNISLTNEIINLLKKLHKKYKLAIVSDGSYETQKLKCEALKLEEYFDEIILTDKLGKEYWKPNIKAFEMIKEKFNIEFDEMAYVGDNPKKDFYVSKYGITTIRYYNKNGIYYNEEYLENIKEEYSITKLTRLKKFEEKIVFVDFFDTIMFRKIHPFQIYHQWASNLINKYSLNTSIIELLKLRIRCFNQSKVDELEVDYKKAIYLLVSELNKNNIFIDNVDMFYKYSLKMEESLEIGTQYPNWKLIRKLNKLKQNNFSKIYILSDFHLGKKSLQNFLIAQNVDSSLFNDILVSSDCNCCKFNGSLYKHAIDILKINKSKYKLEMYGDNYNSDIKMAKLEKIRTHFHPHFFHKINLYIKRKLNYSYNLHVNSIILKNCYKYNKPYSEYITIFYTFIRRLYNECDNKDKLIFLSREGLFLKKLFENFQFLYSINKKSIEKEYFLVSRRATSSINKQIFNNGIKDLTIFNYLNSAGFSQKEIDYLVKKYNINSTAINITNKYKKMLEKDINKKISNNKVAFLKYSKSILKNSSNLHFVDVGWKGTMQYNLEKTLNIKTLSYYIGLKGNLDDINKINKKGLIFSENEKDYYSKILMSNTQLYEELLSAPHGSVKSYSICNNKIKIITEWCDNEKEMYIKCIRRWQEDIILLFNALVCWNSKEYSNERNAKTVLKSGILADNSRINFIKKLDNGFVSNFANEFKGLTYKNTNIRIRLDLLYRPEKYSRYIVKVKRKINNCILKKVFGCIARVYFYYTFIILKIKNFSRL